eukprot:jgi/Psemu1/178014/e_gw1.3.301.1
MGGQQERRETNTHYDFCIVGAGPAGLATLSALSESYTLGENIHLNDAHWSTRALNQKARTNGKNKKRKKKKRICVIDPDPNWLHCWDKNYETLEIEYLRSPVKAHPDAFDVNSLFAYAHSTGRHKKELKESHSLGGLKGNKKLLPLGESQIGIWDLPSSKLFRDFCDKMLISRLPHEYIQGKVADIDHGEDTEDSGKQIITAKAVILAMGAVGTPIVPKVFQSLPPSKLCHWQNLKQNTSETKNDSILVVGGGLTAVQTAQYALRKYPKAKQVVLCSRRPITEKNFDVSENWFDFRSSNRLIGDFYHRPVGERLQILKQARGGGSVPSAYMDEIRCHQDKNPGQFVCVDGDIALSSAEIPSPCGAHEQKQKQRQEFEFDSVWLACGIQPNCSSNPLICNLLKRWPIETVGGFPCVSEDLEWSPSQCPNLLVVGSLSSLNTGPDAANLMGIRRSAAKVANSLDCRSWLRNDSNDEDADDDDEHAGGGVLVNPFKHLDWGDDTDTDDESSTCSSCEGGEW